MGSRYGEQQHKETIKEITAAHQLQDSATVSSKPPGAVYPSQPQLEGISTIERNHGIPLQREFGVDEKIIRNEMIKEPVQLAAVVSIENSLDKKASVELYGPSSTTHGG